jgi:hypothetical protein
MKRAISRIKMRNIECVKTKGIYYGFNTGELQRDPTNSA